MKKRSFIGSRQAMVILGLAILLVYSQAAPLPKDISPKKVKKMGATISRLYDPPRSTWLAEKIRVAGDEWQ
jgi:hypothetical protein